MDAWDHDYRKLHNVASCFTHAATLEDAIADFETVQNQIASTQNGVREHSPFHEKCIKNLIKIHYQGSRRITWRDDWPPSMEGPGFLPSGGDLTGRYRFR